MSMAIISPLKDGRLLVDTGVASNSIDHPVVGDLSPKPVLVSTTNDNPVLVRNVEHPASGLDVAYPVAINVTNELEPSQYVGQLKVKPLQVTIGDSSDLSVVNKINPADDPYVSYPQPIYIANAFTPNIQGGADTLPVRIANSLKTVSGVTTKEALDVIMVGGVGPGSGDTSIIHPVITDLAAVLPVKTALTVVPSGGTDYTPISITNPLPCRAFQGQDPVSDSKPLYTSLVVDYDPALPNVVHKNTPAHPIYVQNTDGVAVNSVTHPVLSRITDGSANGENSITHPLYVTTTDGSVANSFAKPVLVGISDSIKMVGGTKTTPFIVRLSDGLEFHGNKVRPLSISYDEYPLTAARPFPISHSLAAVSVTNPFPQQTVCDGHAVSASYPMPVTFAQAANSIKQWQQINPIYFVNSGAWGEVTFDNAITRDIWTQYGQPIPLSPGTYRFDFIWSGCILGSNFDPMVIQRYLLLHIGNDGHANPSYQSLLPLLDMYAPLSDTTAPASRYVTQTYLPTIQFGGGGVQAANYSLPPTISIEITLAAATDVTPAVASRVRWSTNGKTLYNHGVVTISKMII